MAQVCSFKAVGILSAVFLFACVEMEGSYETGLSSKPPTHSQTLVHFDFDNGNIASEYVIPSIIPYILQNFAPSDAPHVLYLTSSTVTALFDAIAPYSATMVGIYSRIPRRPASEGVTNRNRNIAIMYAVRHALTAMMPRNAANWRALLENVGLDPDNLSTDLTTPEGIGNFAGMAMVKARARDGFNRDGDEGGRKYNLTPFADYTGYEPVNSALEIKDPSRWQPAVVKRAGGLYDIQKFITPQLALVKPYSYDDPSEFASPPPVNSFWPSHGQAYKRQADEVLRVSANLTDYQKMAAEFFDHKFASLGRGGDHVRRMHNMTLEQFIQYDMTVQVAAFDGAIAMWADKVKFDNMRPFTAIRFLYGDKPLRAWGGPGKGTVNDITGNEWTSYLPVGNHPEYPSGSACFCAAHAQATRRFIGTDEFNWEVPRPAGSSVIEPGITPAQDIVLSFPTLTDFEEQCAVSRMWGGVHFRSSFEEALKQCRPIGDRAYEFMRRHVDGDVP